MKRKALSSPGALINSAQANFAAPVAPQNDMILDRAPARPRGNNTFAVPSNGVDIGAVVGGMEAHGVRFKVTPLNCFPAANWHDRYKGHRCAAGLLLGNLLLTGKLWVDLDVLILEETIRLLVLLNDLLVLTKSKTCWLIRINQTDNSCVLKLKALLKLLVEWLIPKQVCRMEAL